MSPRLSIIPAGAVTDRSLEPRDLQVLCLLGRHLDKLGWCVRSQVKMAIEIACSRSSVQRSLDRLYEAGWVERRRRGDIAGAEEVGQPSASYAYRVRLDRDDYAVEAAVRDASESHAENASRGGGCPPVGTPPNGANAHAIGAENCPQGARPDGHPGAHTYVGTGAHTYVGTKNDPSERSSIERERDARARDRKARFVVAFEARWPTAAADDRQRTAYAAEGLTEIEEEAALVGIGPFLEHLKRHKRGAVPAGWKYLEQKRWALLERKPTGAAIERYHAKLGTHQWEKWRNFYLCCGYREGIPTYLITQQAGISVASVAREWPPNIGDTDLDRARWQTFREGTPQFAAWARRLREVPNVRLANVLTVPSEWPPPKNGGTGPPGALASDADLRDFADMG